jgi:glycosyltransferase involved in cell wall biosynthesis
MRICHISTSFLPLVGGAEYAIHYLASAQTRLNHEVLVLAPRVRNQRLEETIIPYRLHRYPCPSNSRWLEVILWAVLAVTKLRWSFDILHAHMIYPAGYCATIFKSITKIPVVVTSQGADIQIEPAMGYGIRLNPWVDKKVRKTLRLADVITTISRSMKEEIIRAGGDPRKVYLIPNGVDGREFKVKDGAPLENKASYIFAMGRLIHKKGFDTLLEAFSRIDNGESLPNLLIAGEGPEKEKLEKMAKQLGIQDKVKFLGFRYGREKIKLLKGCEFFISLPRREPFGIVLLEALAAGRPVIATNVDGIPDIIDDRINGLLVPVDSPAIAAQAMSDLLNGPTKLEEMSTNALLKSEEYDWSRIAGNYLNVYASTTNNPYRS